ncbi:phosphocholine-specific phospholipase C [Parapedobacter sp. 10938]|uniref:phosphocholine-specific phospholipase C n=1 Tax=Parapedobacter flavus TaxID=3110225 RepID=UPI002DB7C9F3|nr:phospholipase C, phosphocholine-specific [Parapedobacter sp. 10938]MEC3881857.1 phospholipase C, phosphocholine-specific [Parapedobacter sp. 10938]
MDSRRSFLKKAALLAGAAAAHTLPPSIQRALAIDAPAGSTYLDAEHIVFLMQENRSFDHCFGSLRGVRGFNDPRAITLPNGLPVWAQSNAKGETYAPFRLDIKNTKATWMGSLPHGWKDMVYARNDGKMDTWLEAKRAGNPEYRPMPLTMGYYDRQDIPFYYAFADAFTVCDQHFCSSLTGTSPNRSYFWSGTVREEPRNGNSVAHVENGQMVYKGLGWKTYPERLQEAGVSWRVYQNELSLPVGFEGEEEDWLGNFTNNNLEFHRQYHVRFHPAHRTHLEQLATLLENELAGGKDGDDVQQKKRAQLAQLKADLEKYTADNFETLPEVEREIHRRAFATNTEDPDYHRLETIHYTDEEGEKHVQVPRGDIFHQFRKDVTAGTLPTVSWLAAPCNFSDHPGAPWYGAWYVSEALDILTKNPEVWKKTIFVLTYDENDGYFDHVPPFVPPHPDGGDGAVARGIDTADEYVTTAQERVRSGDAEATLESPIGLGFRVPMVVASPWSKGGWVNSEVFDLTSPLQFLEHFLEKKTGKPIKETNISDWRRLVCGDMTSVFRPAAGVEAPVVGALGRDAYVERIFSAKTKGLPGNYTRVDPTAPQWPQQEPGTKPACALPYNLQVTARLDKDRKHLTIRFAASGGLSKTKPVGVPFRVHTLVPCTPDKQPGRTWNFAVSEGEPLDYHWPLANFGDGVYHLQVHGPNGFFCEFKGNADDPDAGVAVAGDADTGKLKVVGSSPSDLALHVRDVSYAGGRYLTNEGKPLWLDVRATGGWYDVAVEVTGFPGFYQRFAGHVETGQPSITDPLMGSIRK